MKTYRVKFIMTCLSKYSPFTKICNTSYMIGANSEADAVVKAYEYLSPYTLRTKVVVDIEINSVDK